jgi:plasmid stability protein
MIHNGTNGMSVSLSVKNVPDELAARLRARAAQNKRSLQGELLSILEEAVGARPALAIARTPPAGGWLSIDEVVERAKRRFPGGTPSSVDLIRKMRDERYGVNSVEPRPARSKRR